MSRISCRLDDGLVAVLAPVLAAVLAASSGGASFPAPAAAAGDLAVITHPQVPVDNLSFAQVRKILMGDQQFWASNLRVTLLMRAPVARERDVVLKSIYQMTEAQFRQYWVGKMFRAEASSGPKIVYSNEMSIELVSQLPGAIAFVDATQVPKGVKVLKINGLSPGEKDYPLR